MMQMRVAANIQPMANIQPWIDDIGTKQKSAQNEIRRTPQIESSATGANSRELLGP